MLDPGGNFFVAVIWASEWDRRSRWSSLAVLVVAGLPHDIAKVFRLPTSGNRFPGFHGDIYGRADRRNALARPRAGT